MAKFKCGGCKNRFPMEAVWASSPIQKFCSRECANAQHQRNFSQDATRPARKPPKPRKEDIPVSVRKAVMKRDRMRCRFCGTEANTQLHHIVYRSQGGKHEESNLITLCLDCHGIVHSDKKRWKPLLLGVVWQTYMGKRYTVPMFERWLGKQ